MMNDAKHSENTRNDVVTAPIHWIRALQSAISKRISAPLLNALCIILFAAFTLSTAVYGWMERSHGWDSVAYVASSIDDGSLTKQQVHEKAWTVIRNAVPESKFEELARGDEYRTHQFENPEAFYSMLQMYRVKALYVKALGTIGSITGFVNAGYIISAIAALMLGFMVLFWLVKAGNTQAALLAMPLLMVAGYTDMAANLSPDLIFSALFVIACYLVLKNNELWALPVFLLAIGLRPGNVVFLFALLLAALYLGRPVLNIVFMFVAGIATYFWISSMSDHMGWWSHFYFSCVSYQNTLVGFDPAFSLKDYLFGFAKGIYWSLFKNIWPWLLFILLFAWGLVTSKTSAFTQRHHMMLLAIVLTFVGKFVLFPLSDDRVYFALIVTFAMVILDAWKPRLVEVPGTTPELR